MQRAYCDHVGKQVYPTFDPSIKVQPSAPEESVKGWYSLYRRSDCSANQESIYNDAIPYAEQGDPDAMLVVGYLLSHGIRTQYDYPRVDILLENKERALPFLQAAADYGLVDAYWETAAILFGRKDAESEALGWEYVEKGAEENEKECLRCLFDHYEGKDDTKAFGYLERLSEAWNTHEYTLKLARWCEEGCGGICLESFLCQSVRQQSGRFGGPALPLSEKRHRLRKRPRTSRTNLSLVQGRRRPHVGNANQVIEN